MYLDPNLTAITIFIVFHLQLTRYFHIHKPVWFSATSCELVKQVLPPFHKWDNRFKELTLSRCFNWLGLNPSSTLISMIEPWLKLGSLNAIPVLSVLDQHSDNALVTKIFIRSLLIMKNHITISMTRDRSMRWLYTPKVTNSTATSSKFQGILWIPFNLWWCCEYNTFPSKLVPFPGWFLLWHYYSPSLGLKILVKLFFSWTLSPIDSSNSHFLTSPLLQSMLASSSSYHFVN